jgi:DNA repair ATPase RecN
MIKNVTLFNFQKHKKLSIDLDRITTIVGTSDTGKSSLCRALNWCLFNNISGNSFITHGKEKCYVSIDVENYGKVTRFITKKENGYEIPEGMRVALGRGGVPTELEKPVNVSEINISDQHDPLFWLTLKPTELIKELNKIANLDWMDAVMQASASDQRNIKAEIGIIEERIETLEKQKIFLDWVDEADNELCILEKQEEIISNLQDQIEKIQNIIASVENINNAQQDFDIKINHFSDLQRKYDIVTKIDTGYNHLYDLISKLESVKIVESVGEFNDIVKKFDTVADLSDNYLILRDLVSKLEVVAEVDSKEDFEDAIVKFEKLNKIQTSINTLDQLVQKCSEAEKQCNQMDRELQKQVQGLEAELDGTCPVCGGEFHVENH